MSSSSALTAVRLPGVDSLQDILIENGRIAAVEESPSESVVSLQPRLFNGNGRLVLPAFVNAHTHLDKALFFDSSTTDVSFENGILRSPLLEVKSGSTLDDIRQRAERVVRRAIQCGTTAIRTHVDVDTSWGLRGMEALCDIRKKYSNLVDMQLVAFAQEGMVNKPENLRLMHEACRMGADIVGGKPGADEDPHHHIDLAFELAKEFDLGIDLHVDVDLDLDFEATEEVLGVRVPRSLESVYLASKAIEFGYQGRVVASHLMSLDSVAPELSDAVMGLLNRAGVAVVTCPSCSLYLLAREDRMRVRRGITPVRRLLDAGIDVAYGTDNVGDAFNLYSPPDMLIHGLLTAFGCDFRTLDDLLTVAEMGTVIPAKVMGLRDYGLKVGAWADLVVIDAQSLYQAMTEIRTRSLVLKRGEVVSMSNYSEWLYGPPTYARTEAG